VAAVQNTFKHKNITKCRERNIHNNKSIKQQLERKNIIKTIKKNGITMKENK
jgi:hypothetical protein